MTNSLDSSPPRGRRTALAALAGAVVIALGAVGSASAAPGPAKCVKGATGIAVGDSVLDAVNYSGGKAYLQKFLGGPSSANDGDVNRQFSEGVSLIRGYLAKNPKACAVVVSIGTNGPVRPTEWDGLMRSLSKVPRVVVVNTYTKNWKTEQNWMPRMNTDIAALQRKFPNVRVADWYTVASKLGSADLPDGVHPDSKKAAYAFVNVVAAALSRR